MGDKVTLHIILSRIMGSRRACNWRMRSKRGAFAAEIGMLEAWMGSMQGDTDRIREAFFSSRYYNMARDVCPRNAAGDALLQKLEQLKPNNHE